MLGHTGRSSSFSFLRYRGRSFSYDPPRLNSSSSICYVYGDIGIIVRYFPGYVFVLPSRVLNFIIALLLFIQLEVDH